MSARLARVVATSNLGRVTLRLDDDDVEIIVPARLLPANARGLGERVLVALSITSPSPLETHPTAPAVPRSLRRGAP